MIFFGFLRSNLKNRTFVKMITCSSLQMIGSEAGKQKMYDDELSNAKSCFKEGANQRYKNEPINTNPVRIPLLEDRGEQSAFFK